MAAKIARGIVAERTRGPITTTRQLARIVAEEKGGREKIDPATRVFQALRIEVNQELVRSPGFSPRPSPGSTPADASRSSRITRSRTAS